MAHVIRHALRPAGSTARRPWQPPERSCRCCRASRKSSRCALDGANAEHQRVGDLLVGLATGEQAGDVQLALRQAGGVAPPARTFTPQLLQKAAALIDVGSGAEPAERRQRSFGIGDGRCQRTCLFSRPRQLEAELAGEHRPVRAQQQPQGGLQLLDGRRMIVLGERDAAQREPAERPDLAAFDHAGHLSQAPGGHLGLRVYPSCACHCATLSMLPRGLRGARVGGQYPACPPEQGR